jgi:uncharacterized membrane protein YebE (DUF533 family)
VSANYFGNVLSAFENGVQMDLRMKLAIEFLKAPGFPQSLYPEQREPDAEASVMYALALASQLFSQAAERGWVKELPDTGELSAPMRRHLERALRAQAFQQASSPRIMEEETPRVTPIAGAVNGAFRN